MAAASVLMLLTALLPAVADPAPAEPRAGSEAGRRNPAVRQALDERTSTTMPRAASTSPPRTRRRSPNGSGGPARGLTGAARTARSAGWLWRRRLASPDRDPRQVCERACRYPSGYVLTLRQNDGDENRAGGAALAAQRLISVGAVVLFGAGVGATLFGTSSSGARQAWMPGGTEPRQPLRSKLVRMQFNGF